MATFSNTYEIRFPRQSSAEELANTLTHGVAVVASVAAAAALLATAAYRVGLGELAGLSMYAGSVIAVFVASTCSHAIQQPQWKHWWRMADQAVIYFMIAGTYTPFILTFLPTGLKWLLLSVVWGIALAGFCSKALWRHRVDAVVILNYILLGWLPAAAMLTFLPWDCIAWMALGGALYTVGAVFLLLDDRIAFFHTAWHLFVVVAAACHYFAVLYFTVI